MKDENNSPRMLNRLVTLADKIRRDLPEPFGATKEQTDKRTEICRAAFAAPYTLHKAEVASFVEITQAARDLERAIFHKPQGGGAKQEAAALDTLFALLEEVETRLPAEEDPFVLLGSEAASLAEVVRAAHGLRYTHFEDSRAARDSAQCYLFAALGKVKFRFPG